GDHRAVREAHLGTRSGHHLRLQHRRIRLAGPGRTVREARHAAAPARAGPLLLLPPGGAVLAARRPDPDGRVVGRSGGDAPETGDLDYVAKHLLGVGKHELQRRKIDEEWEADRDKVIRY